MPSGGARRQGVLSRFEGRWTRDWEHCHRPPEESLNLCAEENAGIAGAIVGAILVSRRVIDPGRIERKELLNAPTALAPIPEAPIIVG
jgi:hypothetical protein